MKYTVLFIAVILGSVMIEASSRPDSGVNSFGSIVRYANGYSVFATLDGAKKHCARVNGRLPTAMELALLFYGPSDSGNIRPSEDFPDRKTAFEKGFHSVESSTNGQLLTFYLKNQINTLGDFQSLWSTSTYANNPDLSLVLSQVGFIAMSAKNQVSGFLCVPN